MSDNDSLLINIENGVATLTLNRPAQFNALSEELLDSVSSKLDMIAGDDSVKAIIIAANGKAFCAGHDLKQMRKSAQKQLIINYSQNVVP